MCCVRHITDKAVCPPSMRLHVADFRPEVVTVYVDDPIVRQTAVVKLTEAGLIVRSEGSKITYA